MMITFESGGKRLREQKGAADSTLHINSPTFPEGPAYNVPRN